MPRMDIIKAWRDGYQHGVKDAKAGKPTEEDAVRSVSTGEGDVVEMAEYRNRRGVT